MLQCCNARHGRTHINNMRQHKTLASLITTLVILLLCNLWFSVHQHMVIRDDPAPVFGEFATPSLETQVYLFDSSSLLLRGVKMKDLNHQWTTQSEYSDLLKLSKDTPGATALHPKRALSRRKTTANDNNNRVVMLWHAVPKTAGTTVQKAIFKHIAETCSNAGEAATQQGAFRDVAWLQKIMTSCTNTHDYGLGGRMTFEPLKYTDNVTILHTIAFRPYKEWARSALNQIVKVSGLEGCKVACA